MLQYLNSVAQLLVATQTTAYGYRAGEVDNHYIAGYQEGNNGHGLYKV